MACAVSAGRPVLKKPVIGVFIIVLVAVMEDPIEAK